MKPESALERLIFDHAPAGIAMLDRDMRYIQVSDRWCLDYAVTRNEILGRGHYDVFPDIPYRWREMHRRGLAGEVLRAREDCWDRVRGTTWVRWEIRPWTQDNGILGGILIFTENITRYKNLEEAVRSLGVKNSESQTNGFSTHPTSEPQYCPYCGDPRLWRDLTFMPPLTHVVASTFTRVRCANEHIFFIPIEVVS
jgi:PAS domain S-box-containing protein